jgi:hypothetical protein
VIHNHISLELFVGREEAPYVCCLLRRTLRIPLDLDGPVRGSDYTSPSLTLSEETVFDD